MNNIVQTLIEHTTLWAPRVGGSIVIFIVFFILAKIIKRIIIKGTERLQLDRNLILLLARLRRAGFGATTTTIAA
jgi:hypothetical protein